MTSDKCSPNVVQIWYLSHLLVFDFKTNMTFVLNLTLQMLSLTHLSVFRPGQIMIFNPDLHHICPHLHSEAKAHICLKVKYQQMWQISYLNHIWTAFVWRQICFFAQCWSQANIRWDCCQHFVSERGFWRDAQRVCQPERSLMSPLAGTKRAS